MNVGKYLTVDETRTMWTGQERKYSETGVPHKSNCKRKPRSEAIEAKTVADGMTGIFLHAEIVQSKEDMRRKAYFDEYQATIANLLRMLEPWYHSFRVVCTDSYWAGVRACHTLLTKAGLHFSGCVKSQTIGFPMEYLKKVEYPARGARVVLQAEMEGQHIFIVGWLDKRAKTGNQGRNYIFTCGVSTTAEELHYKQRRKWVDFGVSVRDDVGVPVPTCVARYHGSAKVIDIANHLMAVSGIEWRTRKWFIRTFQVYCLYACMYVCNPPPPPPQKKTTKKKNKIRAHIHTI